MTYTVIIKKTERWWNGWIEEVGGVCSQGETLAELMESPLSVFEEAIEMEFPRTPSRIA